MTLAAEVCQNREPVQLTFKESAASGKSYVTAITRVPWPDSVQAFQKPPADLTPTECEVCGLSYAECSCDRDIPFGG